MLYIDDNLIDFEYEHPLSFLNEPDTMKVIGHGSLRRLISGLASFVPKGYSPYINTGSSQQSAIADALENTEQLWVNNMLNTSTKGHGSVL